MIESRRAPIAVAVLSITTCLLCFVHYRLFGIDRHGRRRLTEESSSRPLRPWLDPPDPKRQLAWNASRIKWIGRSFYFPAGKRREDDASYLYTPHQIQKALRHHSILFQGDSTVRRFYGTLHSVLSIDVWTGSTSDSLRLPKGFPIGMCDTCDYHLKTDNAKHDLDVPGPPFGIPASYYIRRGLDSHRASKIDSGKTFALEMHSPAAIDYR